MLRLKYDLELPTDDIDWYVRDPRKFQLNDSSDPLVVKIHVVNE